LCGFAGLLAKSFLTSAHAESCVPSRGPLPTASEPPPLHRGQEEEEEEEEEASLSLKLGWGLIRWICGRLAELHREGSRSPCWDIGYCKLQEHVEESRRRKEESLRQEQERERECERERLAQEGERRQRQEAALREVEQRRLALERQEVEHSSRLVEREWEKLRKERESLEQNQRLLEMERKRIDLIKAQLLDSQDLVVVENLCHAMQVEQQQQQQEQQQQQHTSGDPPLQEVGKAAAKNPRSSTWPPAESKEHWQERNKLNKREASNNTQYGKLNMESAL